MTKYKTEEITVQKENLREKCTRQRLIEKRMENIVGNEEDREI